MIRTLTLVGACLFAQAPAFGATLNQTVFINSGTYTAVDGAQFPYRAFNSTSSFVAENTRLMMQPGDTLLLKVINTDSVTHGFDIKNFVGASTTIPAGDSATVQFQSSAPGLYIYYDNLNFPNMAYTGLAGMIVVDNATQPFYWNIKDHQKAWNDSLFNGATVNWTQYYPDYFTLNSRSNPDVNTDAAARVTGGLGDTITIYITNTGRSDHSLHFHGYHCDILFSSANPTHVGRSKDTFPIKRMESLILRLVPDQLGEYPVHDHNLLAVTGGGVYPFGMFLTILIQ